MKLKSLLNTTVLLGLVFFMGACTQNKQTQTKHSEDAIALLQNISEAVHSSGKKSFSLIIDEEKLNSNEEIITEHSVCKIKAVYPNKFFVDNQREKNNFNYIYNGEYFTFYSKDENNYVTLEAPATTAEMIDSLHRAYGFKFPAGDFFYPSFKEDVQEFFNTIVLKGNETIDGEACTKLVSQNANIDINIWVSNATSLPKKFTVVYKNENKLKYEATFNDWDLTPSFDSTVFHFTAPENAHLISVMQQKQL